MRLLSQVGIVVLYPWHQRQVHVALNFPRGFEALVDVTVYQNEILQPLVCEEILRRGDRKHKELQVPQKALQIF